jgi:hypothetical protein
MQAEKLRETTASGARVYSFMQAKYHSIIQKKRKK